MTEDGAAGDLCSGPLPPWARRRTVLIAPGASLPFRESEWRDSLVVICSGELEIECDLGGRRRFEEGAVLWLEGIEARFLHNATGTPLELVAVSRRPRPP